MGNTRPSRRLHLRRGQQERSARLTRLGCAVGVAGMVLGSAVVVHIVAAHPAGLSGESTPALGAVLTAWGLVLWREGRALVA